MGELEQLLGSAAEEVLETMFYSAVFGPGTEEADGPYLSAAVRFEGTRNGLLDVSAPQSTATTLAAAFLGESTDSVADAQVPAVIGELANVMCGVVLARVEQGGNFAIAPPQVSRTDGPLAMPGGVRQIFEIEEGTLAIGLTLEPVPANG
jgi:hypothetical protein